MQLNLSLSSRSSDKLERYKIVQDFTNPGQCENFITVLVKLLHLE